MRVYHQSSSQPYIPPFTALLPVNLLPDVIDTLAAPSMYAAPAMTTQGIQDNNNNKSEWESTVHCDCSLVWLQWAYIYYVYINVCMMIIIKHMGSYHH